MSALDRLIFGTPLVVDCVLAASQSTTLVFLPAFSCRYALCTVLEYQNSLDIWKRDWIVEFASYPSLEVTPTTVYLFKLVILDIFFFFFSYFHFSRSSFSKF